LKAKIYYLVNSGKLIRIYHGIFALDEKYQKHELAGKLNAPSYVSLETVLRGAGFIFQYDREITSVGKGNKKYEIAQDIYSYRNIKDSLLFNSHGIVNKANYSIATPERAFLDMIYFNKNYYFDNLNGFDWRKAESFLKIYNNKALSKRFENYKKNYA
jgi:hypothetical protein